MIDTLEHQTNGHFLHFPTSYHFHIYYTYIYECTKRTKIYIFFSIFICNRTNLFCLILYLHRLHRYATNESKYSNNKNYRQNRMLALSGSIRTVYKFQFAIVVFFSRFFLIFGRRRCHSEHSKKN